MENNTLKGTYYKGKLELEEAVEFEEKMEVIVTFLKPQQKQDKFNLNDFFGLWKDKQIDWTQEIKAMRSEWERDI